MPETTNLNQTYYGYKSQLAIYLDNWGVELTTTEKKSW